MKVIPATAFLRAALESLSLTDVTPAAALQADPRITYTGYIPDAHYPQHNDTAGKLPLLVAVHGTGRESYRFINIWKDFADENKVAVIAPLFPAFLQGPLDIDSYHFLGRPPSWSGEPAETWLSEAVDIPGTPAVELVPNDVSRDLRFDLLLLDLVQEVGTRWPGIETAKFFLTGFSGGGQFSHRFLYLHADRLEGLCVGAPGSTTQIGINQTWPTGLVDFHDIFGQDFDIEAMKAVPILGAVGSNDTEADSLRLRNNVPGTDFGTEEEKSRTRVERVQTLISGWQDAGLNATAVVVPGPGHDMEGVNPPVADFFKALLADWWAKRSG